MQAAKPNEGFRSDALRAALQAAVRGESQALEQLLCKFGGMPGPRPNLKLAAAFATELASHDAHALLEKFADDPAAPDTARVILPIAAAFGWAEQLQQGRAPEACWRALQLLAADERAPVRVATLAALQRFHTSKDSARALIERAEVWLEEEDRETRYGSTAVMLDALTETRALGLIPEPARLCELMSRAVDNAVDAPRAASRSAGRRRLLNSLVSATARSVAGLRGGAEWFREECARAEHPDIREVFSQALQQLAGLSNAPARGQIDELRAALSASAKPIRDPARVRVRPGTGRGRRSRPLR